MPVELRFPVPSTGISINETNRLHWAVKRRRLEPWRTAVAWAWKIAAYRDKAEVLGIPCRVQTTLAFRTAGRRDPHNYVGTVVKAMIDTLVELGVWPDDTPEWVTVDEPVCVKGDEVIVRLVPREAV